MFSVRKVQLKMDVAYTDHSHIIGRGGRQIQSVMDMTNCHIHFPDCNRNSTMEKSNQVSIAGTAVGAEQSRQLIRSYLPLTISFVVSLGCVSQLDTGNALIQSVQRQYNVIVNFKYNTRSGYGFNAPHATVFIRGSRQEYQNMKRAIESVYNHLTDANEFANTVFTIAIDIAAQHHTFVMGKGNNHIKTINQHTGATVIFPEVIIGSAQSFNARKTAVTIRGNSVDSVFMAWLELLSYLPMLLSFELNTDELNNELIAEIMSQQTITIMVRPKPRTNNRIILIKGHEKNSIMMFEARRRILNLDDAEVPGDFAKTERVMPLPPKVQLPSTQFRKPMIQRNPNYAKSEPFVVPPRMMGAFMKFLKQQTETSLGLEPMTPSSSAMSGFIQRQMQCDVELSPSFLNASHGIEPSEEEPPLKRFASDLGFPSENSPTVQSHWTMDPMVSTSSDMSTERSSFSHSPFTQSLPSLAFEKLYDSGIYGSRISARKSTQFWNCGREFNDI